MSISEEQIEWAGIRERKIIVEGDTKHEVARKVYEQDLEIDEIIATIPMPNITTMPRI